tara:strand:- start:182 stop:427 length:246 start_codon:yes stop_codon:yes gene_type:complete
VGNHLVSHGESMSIIWKLNSKKIAQRLGRNTYDKLSDAEAKKIGYSYCTVYDNKEAIKEYRRGYEEETKERLRSYVKGGGE